MQVFGCVEWNALASEYDLIGNNLAALPPDEGDPVTFLRGAGFLHQPQNEVNRVRNRAHT